MDRYVSPRWYFPLNFALDHGGHWQPQRPGRGAGVPLAHVSGQHDIITLQSGIYSTCDTLTCILFCCQYVLNSVSALCSSTSIGGQHQLVAEPIFNGYRARLGRSGASARMKCVPEPGASISFAWSHCGVRARPKRSGTFGWACTVLVQIPGTDHSEFQEAIQ